MEVAILIVFNIIIFIYSVILHEISHGLVALQLGDPTARISGRLTLNPLRHIDIYGSIILPLITLVLLGFPIGAAKPVPYNPYNLRNQKWGPAMVAFGGPLMNIMIALVFAIAAKFIVIATPLKMSILQNFQQWEQLPELISGSLGAIFYLFFISIVFWNVLLAFFNLIPFPPLDGSKIIFALFNIKTETMIFLENFGFIFLLLFVTLFQGILGAVLSKVVMLFFGITI